MKYTRNTFKRLTKEMDYKELMAEYIDVNAQLTKAKIMTGRKENPYEHGDFPVKILKWKRGILVQRMDIINNS